MLFKARYQAQIETLVLVTTGLLLSVGGGMLMGAGSIPLTFVGLIALAGMVALLRPVASLYLVVVAGLVVVGIARLYFPGLEKLQWGVAGLATLLGGFGLLSHLFKPVRRLEIPPNSGVLAVLLLLICASSIVNAQSPNQFIYGFKGYFQVVGLFFAISLLGLSNKALNNLPKLLVAIAMIQLPFVLHQWFVLVPQRVRLGSGVVAEDVVAGTMGANAVGGGSNAILSILLITAISIVAAGYKRAQLKPWKAALIIVVCTVPLLLNSNRIASLYLFIVFLMIFGPAMFRRISRFFAGALLTTLLVAASIWVSLNLGSRAEEYTDWQDLVTTTIERNTAPEIGYGTMELNRLGSLTFWWNEQLARPNLQKLLFGSGPGAAREAQDSVLPVKTLASTRYAGVGIGLTGISTLLWELGIVGLLVVLALHVGAYKSAHYLVTHLGTNPYRQYIAEGFQAAIVVYALALFHKNFFVFHIAYQTLFFTVLGTLSAWHFAHHRKEANLAMEQPARA